MFNRAVLLIAVLMSLITLNPVQAAKTCASIHQIQGASHTSPCDNRTVTAVPGIVTGLNYSGASRKGFYMQDPNPDADPATSEGILVYAPNAAGLSSVEVGDSVQVSGKVSGFRPGGSTSDNLTVTEIGGKVSFTVMSSGNRLPAPAIIGQGGRIPPRQAIENDNCGDIEICDKDKLKPDQEGIDFWQSLTGMLVQVNHALVVGPTTQYDETVIVPDNGASLLDRTAHGGALLTPTSANPQRVYIAVDILKGQGQKDFPAMNVGDTIPAVTGIVDYDFGNFRIELTRPIQPVNGGLLPEITQAQGPGQLALSTFNVENLNPVDPPSKFDRLSSQITLNLKSPDIISVEEIQDNSGSIDDGTVAADQTLKRLITAIAQAGGPAYLYAQIDPINDQDGGTPGGNIRQGFLYNPARVALVNRPGGDSTTANNVTCVNGNAQLQFSPGRIDPANKAWTSSRKPLAAEFMFGGTDVIVIGLHLVAKLGDQALYGHFQPPKLGSVEQRVRQAQIVNAFVAQILQCNPGANIVLLGDLNDFQFSASVKTLAGTILDNEMLTLAADEQYSYDFDGNSQVLDQILISHHLTSSASPQYDVVHINAEFFNDALPNSTRSSDHDPSVIRLSLPH